MERARDRGCWLWAASWPHAGVLEWVGRWIGECRVVVVKKEEEGELAVVWW